MTSWMLPSTKVTFSSTTIRLNRALELECIDMSVLKIPLHEFKSTGENSLIFVLRKDEDGLLIEWLNVVIHEWIQLDEIDCVF